MTLVPNHLPTDVSVRSRGGALEVVDRYTLAVTGLRCVHRVITDLAVFDIGPDGLVLVETAPGVDVSEIRAATAADFTVALDAAGA
ncbi:hypothetical protein [Nocardia asteroides]|uniref:hypothetical protein n=1 Tax=Nocardia asteroides TaxID=1824 RepID=UPI0033C2C970